MNDHPHHPYRRCLVLAGGGLRLGFYGGVYAALHEAGQAPDVILASCGGAVMGAAMAQCPDPAALRAWLLSPQWHAFWQGVTAGQRPQLTHALWGAVQRWYDPRPAPLLTDLWANTLFTPPTVWPLPTVAAAPSHTAPQLIVVVGRLLYGPAQAGQRRVDPTQALFEQTLCTTADTHRHLHPWWPVLATHTAPQSHAPGSAIARATQWRTDVPLAVAARMSVTDMFYFAPVTWGQDCFLGGVVDLLPIELACLLGQEVIMERKAPFDRWLSSPAWRSVLGVDAPRRLADVHRHTAAGVRWLDTTDIQRALPQSYPRKRLDWRHNRIHLQAAPSFAMHQAHAQAQWDYGLERGRRLL